MKTPPGSAAETLEYIATFPARHPPGSPGLATVYQQAVYSFDADGQEHRLQVGVSSAAAASLIRQAGASGGAFITAYNPASISLGTVHNTLADRALRRDLTRSGIQTLPARGGDPAGRWPAEPSYFILGIERTAAELLASRYGQYAMLWISPDGMVELVEIFDLRKAARYPLQVPPLPRLYLGFAWGEEWADLGLSPTEWRRILRGDDFGKTCRASYEGEHFRLCWEFSRGTDLYVSYGTDGATAYDGKILGTRLLFA